MSKTNEVPRNIQGDATRRTLIHKTNIMNNYTEYAYTKMIYGKYKGVYLKDIPIEYIKWAIINIKDVGISTMLSVELQRREIFYRK